MADIPKPNIFPEHNPTGSNSSPLPLPSFGSGFVKGVASSKDVNALLRELYLWVRWFDRKIVSIPDIVGAINCRISARQTTYPIGSNPTSASGVDPEFVGAYLWEGQRIQPNRQDMHQRVIGDPQIPAWPLQYPSAIKPGRIWIYISTDTNGDAQTRVQSRPPGDPASPNPGEFPLVGVDIDLGGLIVGHAYEDPPPCLLFGEEIPQAWQGAATFFKLLEIASEGSLVASAETAVQLDSLSVGSGTAGEITTAAEPYAFLGGDQLAVQIDGGPEKIVILDPPVPITTAAQLAAAINAVVKPAEIVDNGANVTIRSRKLGTLSGVRITANTTANAQAQLGLLLGDNPGTATNLVEINPAIAALKVTGFVLNLLAGLTTTKATITSGDADALNVQSGGAIVAGDLAINGGATLAASQSISAGAATNITGSDLLVSCREVVATSTTVNAAVLGTGANINGAPAVRGVATHVTSPGVRGITAASADLVAAGVSGEGFGDGAGVLGESAEDGHGVRAKGKLDGTGRSSMRAEPQTTEPTQTSGDGDFTWVVTQGGRSYLRARSGGVWRWAMMAKGPPLFERQPVAANVILAGNNTLITASPVAVIHDTIDEVELEIEVTLSISTDAGTATIEFRDSTAPTTIGSLRVVNSIGAGRQFTTMLREFRIPAGTGARDYDVRVTAGGGATTTVIATGYFWVGQRRG